MDPFWNTSSLCPFLKVRDQVSCAYKTRGRITILYILVWFCSRGGGFSEVHGCKLSPNLACSSFPRESNSVMFTSRSNTWSLAHLKEY
jgi:hypothetical protein